MDDLTLHRFRRLMAGLLSHEQVEWCVNEQAPVDMDWSGD